jgi:hypothetical protein
MSDYKLTNNSQIVIRKADGAAIAQGTWLWDHYEAWLAAGNAPDPAQTVDDVLPGVLTVLSAGCAAAIKGGFNSSALGSAFEYPSQDIDQLNLIQSANSPTGGSLWVKDASGAWAFHAHTQAQAQQALADFVASRDKQRSQLSTLQAEASAAATAAGATVETVQAIVWAAAE